MSVVSSEGDATPGQMEPYHTFGERVPALRSFYLAYDLGDANPEDHKIARLEVMVGGDAEDLSPGAGFQPANIPNGQLVVAVQDANPRNEGFFYKVSHSILPPPSVSRRYQIRQVGNAGEVVRKLPQEIFQVGRIPQPHRERPILALVGFQLFYSGNRDHELDRVGIWFRDDELHVVFQDQSVGPTDTYSFLVDFVVIHPGLQMNVSRGSQRGTATGGERVVFPTPSRGNFVLTGWAFNFKNGDHEIRDIGLTRTRNDFTVFYSDKNADDPFDWRIEWAHISPQVVIAPTGGVSTEVDTSYTADSDPDLLNPERGIYYWSTFNGDENITLVPHTLKAEWLYLGTDENTGSEFCNQELTWNGHHQPSTTGWLNKYADKLVGHRNAGTKVVFRPRYDNPGDASGQSNICHKLQAEGLDLQLRHVEAVAKMLGEFKDVVAFIEAGYLGSWGEWNTETGPAPLLDSVSDREAVLRHILQKYDEVGLLQHIGMRRPVFAAEAIALKPDARVGIYNDCFMTNKHDQGTYLNFKNSNQNFPGDEDAQIAHWKQWAVSHTADASFGGETCPSDGNERWRSCSNMVGANSEPAALHMSYLHGGYSPAAIKIWEDGDDEGDTCYDEIRRRLGYRFEVTRVEYTPTVAAGQTFQVRVDVANTGWAKLHKPRQAMLVLRNGSTTHVYNVSSGGAVANWAPGQTTTISVNALAPSAGTYSVRLWIPDPDAQSRIPYAVKLATLRNSANVFDPNTGDNNLGVSITVQ